MGGFQDFKSATTGIAAKAMRADLFKLAEGIKDPDTKKVRRSLAGGFCRADAARQHFEAEMQSFFLLFNRYLTDKAKGDKM
jgi:UTP--glucose-1-phosphate uridylyltransferase